jgi:hypothetical protein
MGSNSDLAGRIAHAWVSMVARHARGVALAMIGLTVAVAVYVWANLGVNTDATDMLSPDLPFRQNAEALDQAFPQLDDNMVVVIDGGNPDRVNAAAEALRAELARHEAILGEVFDPSGQALFRRNGLLYLDDDDLAQMLDRLVAAQPFLGRLWSDPTLAGLFATIELVLSRGAEPGATPGKAAGDLLTAVVRSSCSRSSTTGRWPLQPTPSTRSAR